MIDVSVCIVNFNAKRLLEECIISVAGTIKHHSFEIIVVDNGSNDGSQAIAAGFPRVKFITNPDNLGFIKANNQAFRAASGKYVMALNNDTKVNLEAIDRMAEYLDRSASTGAVGPKLLNSDGTIQRQCRRRFPDPANALIYFAGLSRFFPKRSYLMDDLDDGSAIEVDCLCGAAMMVRREVIDKVGLMDESYFMYGDDIDWCYRIKQAGWKVEYLPSAEIVHYGGMGGSRKRPFRNIFEFHRAMAVYYRKHYSSKHYLPLNALVYSGIWLKFGISILQNLFRKEKFVGTKKPG